MLSANAIPATDFMRDLGTDATGLRAAIQWCRNRGIAIHAKGGNIYLDRGDKASVNRIEALLAVE